MLVDITSLVLEVQSLERLRKVETRSGSQRGPDSLSSNLRREKTLKQIYELSLGVWDETLASLKVVGVVVGLPTGDEGLVVLVSGQDHLREFFEVQLAILV